VRFSTKFRGEKGAEKRAPKQAKRTSSETVIDMLDKPFQQPVNRDKRHPETGIQGPGGSREKTPQTSEPGVRTLR
jgi:hypothetical protein